MGKDLGSGTPPALPTTLPKTHDHDKQTHDVIIITHLPPLGDPPWANRAEFFQGKMLVGAYAYIHAVLYDSPSRGRAGQGPRTLRLHMEQHAFIAWHARE